MESLLSECLLGISEFLSTVAWFGLVVTLPCAVGMLDFGAFISRGLPSLSGERLLGVAGSDSPPDMALFLVKPSLDKASILDLSGVGSLKETLRLGLPCSSSSAV